MADKNNSDVCHHNGLHLISDSQNLSDYKTEHSKQNNFLDEVCIENRTRKRVKIENEEPFGVVSCKGRLQIKEEMDSDNDCFENSSGFNCEMDYDSQDWIKCYKSSEYEKELDHAGKRRIFEIKKEKCEDDEIKVEEGFWDFDKSEECESQKMLRTVVGQSENEFNSFKGRSVVEIKIEDRNEDEVKVKEEIQSFEYSGRNCSENETMNEILSRKYEHDHNYVKEERILKIKEEDFGQDKIKVEEDIWHLEKSTDSRHDYANETILRSLLSKSRNEKNHARGQRIVEIKKENCDEDEIKVDEEVGCFESSRESRCEVPNERIWLREDGNEYNSMKTQRTFEIKKEFCDEDEIKVEEIWHSDKSYKSHCNDSSQMKSHEKTSLQSESIVRVENGELSLNGSVIKSEATESIESQSAFMCRYCRFSSLIRNAFTSHVKLRHDVEVFLCNLCVFSSYDGEVLRRHHAVKHIGVECFFCPQCPFSSSSKENFSKHVKFKHHKINDLYLICEDCTFKAHSKTDLVYHYQRIHHKKLHNCHLCRYKTNFDRSIKSHFLQVHGLENPFLCSFCDFKTNSKLELTQHEKIQHLDHKCLNCGFSGHNMNELRYHIETECVHIDGKKQFFCDKCSYSTFSNNDLSCHKYKEHKESVKFFCTKCTFSSTRKKDFNRHLKSIHRTVMMCSTCETCLQKKQSCRICFINLQSCTGCIIKQTNCPKCAAQKERCSDCSEKQKSCTKCVSNWQTCASCLIAQGMCSECSSLNNICTDCFTMQRECDVCDVSITGKMCSNCTKAQLKCQKTFFTDKYHFPFYSIPKKKPNKVKHSSQSTDTNMKRKTDSCKPKTDSCKPKIDLCVLPVQYKPSERVYKCNHCDYKACQAKTIRKHIVNLHKGK